MISEIDNSTATIRFFPSGAIISAISDEHLSEKKNSNNKLALIKIKARPNAVGFNIRVEDFIWFEISIVDQVECVIVERKDDGKMFDVVTVINDRDHEIRQKIYARERAVMEAHPALYFVFYVQSRLGRPLEEVVRDYRNVGNNIRVFKKASKE